MRGVCRQGTLKVERERELQGGTRRRRERAVECKEGDKGTQEQRLLPMLLDC